LAQADLHFLHLHPRYLFSFVDHEIAFDASCGCCGADHITISP